MTWEPPEAQTLQEQAALLHELHTSLVNEGFSEQTDLNIIMGQPCCQLNQREE